MTPADQSREEERGYLRGYEQRLGDTPINTDENMEVWAAASEIWKSAWSKGYEDASQGRPNFWRE